MTYNHDLRKLQMRTIFLSVVLLLSAGAFVSTDANAQSIDNCWQDPQVVNRTVTFGINLALDIATAGSSYPQQVDTKIGLEIWRDSFNSLHCSARTTRSREVITVALHVETWSGYNQGFTAEALSTLCGIYGNMSMNSSIDYLFGPVALLGVAVRKCVHDDYGVELMVASGDSSEAYYNIPGSFGSPTANILTMTSWLPYLRVSKAKTIAVLRINDYVYQSEMCQGIVDEASLNGITTVLYQDMPFDWYTLGAIDGQSRKRGWVSERGWVSAEIFAFEMRSRFGIDLQSAGKRDVLDTDATRSETWTQALDKIIELKPDAIAICDYGYGSKFALKYLKSMNWNPKSFAITPLYLQYEDPSLLDFVIMPAGYSPLAHYVAQINFTDSAGYSALVAQNYDGRPATPITAQATLAGIIYTNAILNSKSNSTEDMIITIQKSQIRTFMGTATTDVYNHNTLSTLVTQLLDSRKQVHIVGPANAAIDEFIYPMPTWKERVFDNKWGSPMEIGGLVIMSLGLLVSIISAIIVVVYREERVIVGASPIFCYTMIFGNAVVSASPFTFMPNLVSTAICMLRPWLLPLGFMILFGALLAKTDRINKLFNKKGIETKSAAISNKKVALTVGIIILPQIILSVLMVSIPPQIKAKLVTVDPYRPSRDYYACNFAKHAKALVGINVAYAFGLLVWGTYLAYRVRKVGGAEWNESKVVVFSIYNTALFAAIAIIVQWVVGNNNRQVTFLITVICCIVGSCITTGCLFGMKLYYIYSEEYKTSRDSTRVTGATSKGHRSSVHSSGGASDDGRMTRNSSPPPIADNPGRRHDYSLKKNGFYDGNQNGNGSFMMQQLVSVANNDGGVVEETKKKKNKDSSTALQILYSKIEASEARIERLRTKACRMEKREQRKKQKIDSKEEEEDEDAEEDVNDDEDQEESDHEDGALVDNQSAV